MWIQLTVLIQEHDARDPLPCRLHVTESHSHVIVEGSKKAFRLLSVFAGHKKISIVDVSGKPIKISIMKQYK